MISCSLNAVSQVISPANSYFTSSGIRKLFFGLLLVLFFGGNSAQGQGQGYALTFNGTNQYVNLPYGNTTSTAVTVEFWFRTTATQTACLFGQSTVYPSGAPTSWVPVVSLTSLGKIKAVYWSGTEQGITSASSYNDGKYHHLAFVGNLKSHILYIDGVSVGTTTTANNINQSWWTRSTIGVGYGSTAYGYASSAWSYFPGTIDEVCIRNDARTLAEIQSNMASGIVGNEAGLAAY